MIGDYLYALFCDSEGEDERVLRYESEDALLKDFDRFNYELSGRYDYSMVEIDAETAHELISEATDKNMYRTDNADMWVI